MIATLRRAASALVCFALASTFVLVVPGSARATSPFVVTSTGDTSDANPGNGACADTAGACTLRAALQEAAALAGTDTISFNLPGGAPFTIMPATGLPFITDAVVIDGTTQPGYAGNPVVEIDGSLTTGSTMAGLYITSGSTVKGLVINRFVNYAILIEWGSGSTIRGNYLGTDASGTSRLSGMNYSALGIRNSSSNVIGGVTAAERNVIAGSSAIYISYSAATSNVVRGNYLGMNATGTGVLGGGPGVVIFNASNNTIGGAAAGAGNLISGASAGMYITGASSSGNVVQGNYIGTDATGTLKRANTYVGVQIDGGAHDNTLGGMAAGAGNLISGNGAGGVVLQGPNNVVQGNRIGTDAAGTTAIGNTQDGVIIQAGATGNTIGGTSAAARNIISASTGAGVHIVGTSANTVQGNYIGTDATGTTGLPNTNAGVLLENASNNTIGGTAAGAGNTIAFNGGAGISLFSGTGDAFLGNSISSNSGLGIDLFPNGVTPNDAGDGDTGANNLQNFPVLSSASVGGGATTVQGTLNSAPNTTFRLEFSGSPVCDGSANGEGATFLGSTSVTTDGSGNALFSANALAAVSVGNVVTATATDPNNNTSEFSACVTSVAAPSTYTLTVTKSGAGSGTVTSWPSGIDCGSTCSATYAAGTSVNLYRTWDDATSSFIGWSGGGCSGQGDCTVTMNSDKTISAEFTAPRLTATPHTGLDPAGQSITISGTGYKPNDHLQIQQCREAPGQGYCLGFDTVTTDANGTFTKTETVAYVFGTQNDTRNCDTPYCFVRASSTDFNGETARARIDFAFSLSVAKSGTGDGTVTSTPAGIDCGSNCSAAFDIGTLVDLGATPNASSVFTGWSGDCSGVGSCTVTMDQSRTVTANFAKDTTAPTIDPHEDITAQATGASGADVTYTSPATHDAVDGDGTASCLPASGSTFSLGTTTVTCSATDAAGNTATSSFEVEVSDTIAPTIDAHGDITAQATGASGADVTYTSPATHDAVDGDGTASCLPASGSTFSLGTTTVTCSATDAAGNTATSSFEVHVVYSWSEFFQPVDNSTPTTKVWNKAKAGSAIPVKFSLGGNRGLTIFASQSQLATLFPALQPASSPWVENVSCPGGNAVIDTIESTVTNASGLTYDPISNQYGYVWKTPTGYANSCRLLHVTLADGTDHVAYFTFT